MKPDSHSRRNFLKTMGAAGMGALVAKASGLPEAKADSEGLNKVPRRPFGKTGEKVSILALGGNGTTSNLLMMHQAIKWGVTFWDAWDSDRVHGGGISQRGVGKYLKNYPQDRKQIFLMTKTDDHKPKALSQFLEKALTEMGTDVIDFFVVHSVSSMGSLHSQTREWAAKTKDAGKIRFFGVSSHSRMEKVMNGAAKSGWIDGLMVTYNYRVMHTESMQGAVENCCRAGVALVAMKTQGKSFWDLDLFGSKAKQNLTDAFIQKGYTPAQANLKAVWTNPHIASLTSMMLNMNHFSANVAAALDKTQLSHKDLGLMKAYAEATCSAYCAGCTHICQSAVVDEIPIGDVMRYLMYARSYGDGEHAASLFGKLPERTRRTIANSDYSLAEKKCPQKIAIGKMMASAAARLRG